MGYYKPKLGCVRFYGIHHVSKKLLSALEEAIPALPDKEISVAILLRCVRVDVLGATSCTEHTKRFAVYCAEIDDKRIDRVVEDILSWLAKGELMGWE